MDGQPSALPRASIASLPALPSPPQGQRGVWQTSTVACMYPGDFFPVSHPWPQPLPSPQIPVSSYSLPYNVVITILPSLLRPDTLFFPEKCSFCPRPRLTCSWSSEAVSSSAPCSWRPSCLSFRVTANVPILLLALCISVTSNNRPHLTYQ